MVCMHVQIIYHVAERVKELHALGLVHRDLKPGNVMWLPRQNRWTIIDFGCAARANFPAPVACSLGYAAPEVVVAYRSGQKTINVSVCAFHFECTCKRCVQLILQ